MKTAALLAAALAAGCASPPEGGPPPGEPLAEAEVRAVAVARPPIVDGLGTDEAWDAAPETLVPLQGPAEAQSCRVRAVVHEGTLYLLVRWRDSTEDRVHKPWVRGADGKWKSGPDLEDALAVGFPISGPFTANMRAPVEAAWDVWVWKACRTDPAGHAMDKVHRYTFADPGGKRAEVRLPDGRTLFIARPEDAGESATEALPEPPGGENAPRFRARRPKGSAADVTARGAWEAGEWTVECARALHAGHPDDRDLADLAEVPFALAVLDHAEDEDHSTSRVLRLRFPPR